MAQPKKKTSSRRQGHTRHHWKGELPSLTTCNNCRAAMVTHHVCPTCGHYRGRQVVNVAK